MLQQQEKLVKLGVLVAVCNQQDLELIFQLDKFLIMQKWFKVWVYKKVSLINLLFYKDLDMLDILLLKLLFKQVEYW
jgi:hypothetical protein